MPKKKAPACHMAEHPDHQSALPRLNRIAGQVNGVKKMIEERRYCPDILTQLRAIRAAVNSIEAGILETHIDACVSDALRCTNEADKEKKISELKHLYRRFNA